MSVKKISCCVQRIHPINRWKTGLEQEGAHNIIYGAKSALSPPILLRGIWARHSKDDTMGEEERAGRGMIKFTTIIALNCLNGGVELRAHI
jgi:hypothetical protein